MLSPVAPACVAQDDVEPLLLAHLRAQPGARVELGVRAHRRPGGAGRRARRAARRAHGGDAHGPRALRRGGRRRAQRGARRARHPAARRRGRDGGLHDAVPRAAVGRRRPASPPALLRDATRGAGRLPAHRPVRPLAVRRGQGERAPASAGSRSSSAAAPACPACRCGSSARARFSAAAQLAERFRSGPVFLAGDAAHRVTPRGGTGLNLALHDGFDLGWKLAWVLRDWARPGAARHLRGRAPSRRRAHRRAVGRSRTARAARPSRRCTPTSAAGSPTSGRASARRSTCSAPG